jgi:hypothetical protein
LSANRRFRFKEIGSYSENQNMTTDEDRRPRSHDRVPREAGAGTGAGWAQRTRRRLKGQGFEQRFHAKPFLLGLSYGFALGFILEAILASHP